MTNQNYRKGRRKEYSIIDKLRSKFNILQRTSGSHSPFDIIAINKETKEIKLIQVKPDNFPEKGLEQIYEINKDLSGSFIVNFEIM